MSENDIPAWDATTPFLESLARGPARPAAEPAAPGPETVGRHRILRRLGQGGMGEVFLALDATLQREVALKRILPGKVQDDEVRRRFLVESRVTAMLQHPSIVPVYEFSETDGSDVFYTMRPIQGQTLADLLKALRADRALLRDDWPIGRLVRLFLQGAHAVAFAHSRGVIHRDLKPANIMIGPFEEVLVLDWGLAKLLADGAANGAEMSPAGAADVALEPQEELGKETSGRRVVGTPAYMAPERLAGEPASFKTDIYALGLILYELLALEPPWAATNVAELRAAMATPPELPSRLQPGRGIAAELDRAVLKAIELDPRARYESVTALTHAVANALEGRAEWKEIEESRERGRWSLSGGKLTPIDDHLFIESRGVGTTFRYVSAQRLGDNLRLEFEFSITRGAHELSVWLNAAWPADGSAGSGYELQVLPGRRRTLSLLRSGRVAAGGSSPNCAPRRWHKAVVVREDDRFSLELDGEEVYVYHDPIPLSGGRVGLSGQSVGLRLRGLRVFSRGVGATVSCLSIPDAFFNRRLYEEAHDEYLSIAASLPGRDEGRIAAFRAGLSLLEMARAEEHAELRPLIQDDARQAFEALRVSGGSCLGDLGRAMLAAEQGRLDVQRESLAAAFQGAPRDPHLAAAREWLLAQLHGLAPCERRRLAELLPLALDFCREGWGRRLVHELLHEARRAWEFPSFMTSRSRFRENDPVTQAESQLFFGFWGARVERIERAVKELAAPDLLKPHHVSDAAFALVELGEPERAAALLREIEGFLRSFGSEQRERVWQLSWAGIESALGDRDSAERRLASVAPDPADRAFNSARLALALGQLAAGAPREALKSLRPLSPRDSFAREQQARLYLQLGEPARAARQLELFVERNDHRTGKNLANFLHGVTLLMLRREDQAMETFACLPAFEWPRTWMLGSHYASERLGGGKLATYLENAFPWERKHLRWQVALLRKARGEALGEDERRV